MTAFTQGLAGLVPAQPQAVHAPAVPKISVKIPIYHAAPEENVMTWMLQCQNIFAAQGIVDPQTRIQYAATGFEGAALHWYLNRVQAAAAANQPNVFADWNAFATALRTAFQPPNFQHYLRQQLKKLRQTGTVQEYGMEFKNILNQITDMGKVNKITYFTNGLKPVT